MNTRLCYSILVLALTAAAAHAGETLSVVPDSAQALGIVGGRYANLNDASSVRVSPANMLQIKQTELLFNAAMWNGDIHFAQNGGQSVTMNRPWVFPASMYLVKPIIEDRLSFGLGVSTPYGMASSYPKGMAAPLRYALPYYSNLLTVDITPAVAFKVTDGLSVAAGLDIMYADLQIQQFYPWAALVPGSPEGNIQVHGQGWGLGAYGAINYTIAKKHRFALIGRLPTRVNFKGGFTSNNMPSALYGGGFTPTSNFNSDMTFPGSISAGYGYDVSDRFTIGFDFKWSVNSSQSGLPLLIGNNQPLLGPGNTGTVFGWRNSIDVGTGMTYRLSESWVVRGGYLFSENSQPANSYGPMVCTNNRSIFSLGIGWRGQSRSVDVTYAYVYNPTRVISGSYSNPPGQFDGSYTHQWQVFSLSVTQRF